MTPVQFEVFYDDHAPRAYGLACAILGSEREAQTVVQEAFLLLWERARTTPQPAPSLDGLLAEVRRLSCKQQSASTRLAQPQGDCIAPLLEQIPLDVRHVLQLAYFRGVSAHEVSTCLGLSVSEVHRKMQEGLHLLRAPQT